MKIQIEHQRLEANGIGFHLAVSGRQAAGHPPILFVHGFPEGWMGWRPVMELLNEETRMYAFDLRGYSESEYPRQGYDVFTLTDDIRAVIEALDLQRPLLVTHDWGGALGWIFAHRYPELISQLMVVNCTHPRTLVRAVLHFDDFQTLRIPWVPFFMVPRLPEIFLTSRLGRKLLKLSFTLREGRKGTMDVGLVDEIVARFQRPEDFRGPVEYYREMVWTQLLPGRRAQLEDIYRNPITVPVTLVWGLVDRALSAKVARKSHRDAGCEVEWRPLPGVGHFVDLEAPDELAEEIRRVLGCPAQAPDRLKKEPPSD